ncbi:MAG: endolytic transglycosylase MltG [Bryobacterales bacterium]
MGPTGADHGFAHREGDRRRRERPLVSSVYYNRIRLGMLLQCDPTIIYGLILDDRYRGKIYESDIRDPHDYNTYVHPGLPPGPIANPGLASLKAAFHQPTATISISSLSPPASRRTSSRRTCKPTTRPNRAISPHATLIAT